MMACKPLSVASITLIPGPTESMARKPFRTTGVSSQMSTRIDMQTPPSRQMIMLQRPVGGCLLDVPSGRNTLDCSRFIDDLGTDAAVHLRHPVDRPEPRY